ncbi:hypothetical protein SB758_40535, partial [Burkholderia sp. SIMBA_013]
LAVAVALPDAAEADEVEAEVAGFALAAAAALVPMVPVAGFASVFGGTGVGETASVCLSVGFSPCGLSAAGSALWTFGSGSIG